MIYVGVSSRVVISYLLCIFSFGLWLLVWVLVLLLVMVMVCLLWLVDIVVGVGRSDDRIWYLWLCCWLFWLVSCCCCWMVVILSLVYLYWYWLRLGFFLVCSDFVLYWWILVFGCCVECRRCVVLVVYGYFCVVGSFCCFLFVYYWNGWWYSFGWVVCGVWFCRFCWGVF